MRMSTEHSNEQEFKFIDSIGSNSVEATQGRICRRDLLLKYLVAIRQRTDWKGMDKYLVVNYTRESLAKEML